MLSTLNRAYKAIKNRIPVQMQSVSLEAPLISFCFDDAPASAFEIGRELIEAHGARATYYVCGGFEGVEERELPHFSEDQLKSVYAAGHEIGCHTFDHLAMDGAATNDINMSLNKNEVYLKDRLGEFETYSFAYPFGAMSLKANHLVKKRFPIARSTLFGLNHGWVDFNKLRAVSLCRRWEERVDLKSYLDKAEEHKSWLIFYTHDVSETPSFEGCHKDKLAKLLDEISARDIEMLTVKEAAKKILPA